MCVYNIYIYTLFYGKYFENDIKKKNVIKNYTEYKKIYIYIINT